MQHHPPVAQLVAEALDQQRGVAGHDLGGGALVVEQLPQVVDGVVRETQLGTAYFEGITVHPGQLTGEPTHGLTQFGRASRVVAAPERQPRRLPGSRDDQHPVVGDLGDAPTGRAQRDDIAGPRLVDHLLVEFTYPRRLFGLGGQVHGEHPAVRDGAAGGDGQPLRARAGGQRAGVPVVDQPGPQFGEIGGRVLAGQQIQGGLERAARQRGERRAAADHVEPDVGVERLQRTCGHRVLGQHVERVGGHPHGLDLAGQHALHTDRAADEVGAVFGEQHAAGDLAHLVAGASDALQAAGHRRRGLHLDHQIDGPHVDAEFEAGGRDDRLEPAALEVVLHRGALLLGYRPVVGAGQQWFGAVGLAAGHDVGGWAAGHRPVRRGGQLDA